VTRRTWTVPVVSVLLLAALSAPAVAADNAAAPPSRTPTAPVPWTVDNVVEIALKNHPLVKQSESDIDAAAARKGQAESGWYPFLNLSAGYSRTRTFNAGTDQSTTVPNEFIRGDLNWILADFGRTRASVDRADALAAAVREGAAATREDVAFFSKVAYYNVLRTKINTDSRRESLRQRESLLRQASAFFEAGVRAKIDVVRAEANLYDARAQLSQAENALRVARITLLQRIGVDGPADFELVSQLPEMALPGSLPDWIAEAERNRPELRGLLEQERAATESLRLARSGYYPYLAATGGYGYGADQVPLQQNYGTAVTLNYPLFSGYLTREQVREASATISSARYQTVEARRRVHLEVESSAYGVAEAQERMGARKKQREATEENLRLATARYEVGAGDIIEMIDAQTQMVGADTDSVNAAFDYAVSIASLLRAMGR